MEQCLPLFARLRRKTILHPRPQPLRLCCRLFESVIAPFAHPGVLRDIGLDGSVERSKSSRRSRYNSCGTIGLIAVRRFFTERETGRRGPCFEEKRPAEGSKPVPPIDLLRVNSQFGGWLDAWVGSTSYRGRAGFTSGFSSATDIAKMRMFSLLGSLTVRAPGGRSITYPNK
jgi:hypothetical protein